MFWSGNYIAVRELNSLLKEENVSLSQVLEADDILQECKADNKALIQFLTRPEILADLISLIIEEPPKNVELASQYRLANIACEVLTSPLSLLSDRLSLDATQMHRLCDFINRDPPLNPLLASYFSKTVEMLLEKSPKQDWCLHHIVCLRVLDFFKSRRDFLPNLLRHMSTSAIADIFKYLLRIDDLIKTVMEWLEEHQFLECLIQIICGTYVPEVFPSPHLDAPAVPSAVSSGPHEAEMVEKSERETSEKPETNHTDEKVSTALNSDGDNTRIASPTNTETDDIETGARDSDGAGTEAEDDAKAIAEERRTAAASANAAALLCDLIVNGCRSRTEWAPVAGGGAARGVCAALARARGVRALLQGMFTSPPRARAAALVHGAHVLLALLHLHPGPVACEKGSEEECGGVGAEGGERSGVELAVAPHLPLLHQALLQPPPARPLRHPAPPVGLPRVQVAALLAHLALSEVEEVATTMLTLGTPGVLVDMFFQYPHNNFLHAQVYTMVCNALSNKVYRTQYARHLLVECDLLTRLMDLYEDNRTKKAGAARSASVGHAASCLAAAARAQLPGELLPARWAAFCDQHLQHRDTPLGGYYPSENFYEMEIIPDTSAASYDYNDMATTGTIEELAEDVNEMCGAVRSTADTPDFIADGLGIDDSDKLTTAKNNFLELASQRCPDDMWEDSEGALAESDDLHQLQDGDAPADRVRDVLDQHSPWEWSGGSGGTSGGAGEGWAQFADPSTDQDFAEFSPFWSYTEQPHESHSTTELDSNLRSMRLDGEPSDKRMDDASSAELANNLLTAMSAMSPDAIANIVNANLPPSRPVAAPAATEPPATSATPATPATSVTSATSATPGHSACSPR